MILPSCSLSLIVNLSTAQEAYQTSGAPECKSNGLALQHAAWTWQLLTVLSAVNRKTEQIKDKLTLPAGHV